MTRNATLRGIRRNGEEVTVERTAANTNNQGGFSQEPVEVDTFYAVISVGSVSQTFQADQDASNVDYTMICSDQADIAGSDEVVRESGDRLKVLGVQKISSSGHYEVELEDIQ